MKSSWAWLSFWEASQGDKKRPEGFCLSLRFFFFSVDTCPHSLKSSPPSTAAAAPAKSLQSCTTLCDPIDDSPLGCSVPGILQARILEWVAISFFNAWKWQVKVKSLSRARLLATPWTAAYQASLSMGVSRRVYWSGSPLPSLRMDITRWLLLKSDWLYSLLLLLLSCFSRVRLCATP